MNNIVEKKKCPTCKKIKLINKFGNHKKRKGGKRSQCKECEKDYRKERYLNNIENERKKARNRYHKNREKYLLAGRLWRKNNPEKRSACIKKWIEENPEKYKESHRRACRKYYSRNPNKTKEWIKNNPEKRKETTRRHYIKCRTTPVARLNSSVSSLMRFYLKGNKGGAHWEQLVGFTIKQLKKHLESQFVDGMAWGNYGANGWHIDHKIPISVFNFEKPEDDDFKKCWSLKNLQPMWGKENVKKGNSLERHFQPSLIFKKV